MNRAKLLILAILAVGASMAAGCTVVDQGVFHATWTVNGPGGPVTCESRGADKADFLFTQKTNSMGFDELFDCADLAGDTDPLPLDDYTYVATLLSCPNTQPGCPNSTTLLMSDPQDATTDICDSTSGSNCNVDLPTFNFNFAQ
jgi:hypothetical protein